MNKKDGAMMVKILGEGFQRECPDPNRQREKILHIQPYKRSLPRSIRGFLRKLKFQNEIAKLTLANAIEKHPWLNGWDRWALAVLAEGLTLLVVSAMFKEVAPEAARTIMMFAGVSYGIAYGLIVFRQYVADKLVDEASQ